MFYQKQGHVILSGAKNPSYSGKKDDGAGKKEILALFPTNLNLLEDFISWSNTSPFCPPVSGVV